MPRTKRFLLSIDGSGVRGLIPLRLLDSLKTRLSHRGAERPFHDIFDLMCGTSTGGLIAAALSAPKPDGAKGEPAANLDELRDFFENNAREIYKPSIQGRLSRMVTNPLGLLDESYDPRPLEKLLKEHFGWTSMTSAMCKLVVPAYDMEKRKAAYLANGLRTDGTRPDDHYIWQAVRAGMATPSVFEPARIENLTHKREDALVDGSVFMKNPVLAALSVAQELGWGGDDLVILSLGTGYSPERAFSFTESLNWGALGWMQPSNGSPLLSISADGQAAAAAEQMEGFAAIAPNVSYFRIDGEIPPESEAIDNARPGNITILNAAADRIIRDRTADLDQIADLLTEASLAPDDGAEHGGIGHAA